MFLKLKCDFYMGQTALVIHFEISIIFSDCTVC